MGKMLVPITPAGSGWSADYAGQRQRLETREDVKRFRKQLAEVGVYSYECEEDELAQYADATAREELIRRMALERVREWMELAELMEQLFAQLERPESALASLHVPPYGSHLDDAPRLDDALQVQSLGGEPEMVPVGSSAVRDVLSRHQPLLGLHGHIHEGQGR